MTIRTMLAFTEFEVGILWAGRAVLFVSMATQDSAAAGRGLCSESTYDVGTWPDGHV